MISWHIESILAALAAVAAREEQRALAEFAAAHGRPYDGSRDDDWDRLDKSYVQVGAAMGIVSRYGQ